MAQVAGHDPAALAAELGSHGVNVGDPGKTIKEIAMEKKKKETAVLEMIF